MHGVARRWSPFRPGAGTIPPLLAGREAELSVAGELLDGIEAGDPPSEGLLLVGPRGNGKTTLLVRIAEDARRRGMRAESLPVSDFGDPGALTRRLRERTAGVSAEIGELLAEWIGSAGTPLVVLLDEAYAIEPEAGRAFFDAVLKATTRRLPFLLLVAGTPDTPGNLRRAGTFTEQALRPLRIGRLVRAETVRALVEPAHEAGLPVRDDAARFLAAESQDYPWFIQLLGEAAWDAADDAAAREITMESAREGTAATRSQIEIFFSERFSEAREHGVHMALGPLAALVSERGGTMDDDALDRFLAREAPAGQEAKLLETLTDLGVLWETEPGVWELAIPSFAEHILRRQAR